MSNSLTSTIHERLQVLSPQTLIVTDESHHHVGHAGAAGGASHFALIIVTSYFNNMRSLERHRLVYSHLSDLIPFPIHALAIQAYTPQEVKEQNLTFIN